MAKTAKQLGITAAERRALPKIRDGLREGRYLHVKSPENDEGAYSKPIFNMGVPYTEFSCGQAGCIGGWVAIELKMPPDEAKQYVYSHDGAGSEALPLTPLFYPPDAMNYDNITPKRAAQAIDNFLNGSKKPWFGTGRRKAA